MSPPLPFSGDQLGAVFDCLSAGLVLLSADRTVVSLNRTAEALTGMEPRAVVGRPCQEAFAARFCEGDCLFHSAARQGGPLTGHLEIREPDGETRQLLKIVAPLRDAGGGVLGCMEIFQDVTAFQELMERIGRESRRLREILDHLDIGVFTCDRGGHITFFNTMAETITGYLRRETLGQPYEKFFPAELCRLGPAASPDPQAAGAGAGAREIEITTSDGRPRPLKVKSIPLAAGPGRDAGALTTFSDLSLVYHYRNALKDRYTFYDMVSNDPAMHKIFEILPAVAESDTTVLIEGPTGTGKDLLAKVIHTASPRKHHPLVKVNCAALPGELLESEMFGYAKGAFTGAERDKPGRFQDADGGTIFLDEIGDLPLSLQAKLLRVLEDREFYPLGSRRPTRVDVRIVSATNRGLHHLVAEGRFRQDLFYRLNVMRLELPPLHQRPGDIPLLIQHVLERLCAEKNRRIDQIAEDALAILLNHDYPGNVRELENILEHALIICRGRVIEPHHLPLELQAAACPPATPATPAVPPAPAGEGAERRRILEALARHGGNRARTARSLGMDRTTLWRKIKRYGIEA